MKVRGIVNPMQYVKGNNSNSTSTWLRRLSVISTAPAKPYPILEERVDYGQEKAVPSVSPFHRISSTRAWLDLRGTR